MSIEDKVKKTLVSEDTVTIAGIKLHKVTASSFTLCELLDLKLIKAEETKHPQFEILAFLWIHHVGAKVARKSVLDDTLGEDSNGRSMNFVNTVLDWADEISFKSFSELAQGVGEMLNDSFDGAVEAVEEVDEGKAGNDAKV